MLAYFFIFLGAVLRIVPHPANFAPIAALALFGGAHLNRKYALLVPLAAMLVSDWFIGFDSWNSRIAVYGCFLLSGAIGLWLKSRRKSAAAVAGGALASSVLFFLVTNLPFVHPVSLYPQTLEGTLASYANGLPFFKYTLLGDLFYTAAFFLGYQLAVRLAARRQTIHADSSPRPN